MPCATYSIRGYGVSRRVAADAQQGIADESMEMLGETKKIN